MIGAVFFDVGETLVNEGRMWAALGAHVGLEPHVTWAGVGAAIARGDQHWQAWELLGVERPDPGSVGLEDAELYPDAEPCLRRLRADGYFIGLAGNVGRALGPVVEHFGLDVDWRGLVGRARRREALAAVLRAAARGRRPPGG